MTPQQFRSTRQWKDTRKRMLRHATTCAYCGHLTTRVHGPKHRLAPSVDHIQPLVLTDLSTVAGRAFACGPENLRIVHIGCNSKRAAKMRRRVRSAPQVWNLNDYAPKPKAVRW